MATFDATFSESNLEIRATFDEKIDLGKNAYDRGFADALAKRTDLVATENGEYTPTGDSTGFKRVSVSVNTQPSQGSYEDGYNDGYQNGLSEGYENGYNEGSSEGYDFGYTNGRSDALAQLKELVVKENGEYLPQDGIGFNKVIVNVPQTGGDTNDPDEPNDAAYIVTLGEDGIARCTPEPYEADYHLYRVVDGVPEEVAMQGAMTDSADFSSNMGSAGVYFVVCHVYEIDYESEEDFISNTVKIEGADTPDEPTSQWVLTPKAGAERADAFYIEDGYLYTSESDEYFSWGVEDADCEFSEWFHIEDGLDLGTLDVTKTYYVYDDVAGEIAATLEYKVISGAVSEGWTLASDGMGVVRIENGYLYTDADPMRLEDEGENIVGYFDLTNPLDLSELDTGKVYLVWDDVNYFIVTALFYKQTEDEWALNFVNEDYNTLYFANGYLRSYDVMYYLGVETEVYINQQESLDLSELDTSTRYMIYNEGDSSEVAELYYIHGIE